MSRKAPPFPTRSPLPPPPHVRTPPTATSPRALGLLARVAAAAADADGVRSALTNALYDALAADRGPDRPTSAARRLRGPAAPAHVRAHGRAASTSPTPRAARSCAPTSSSASARPPCCSCRSPGAARSATSRSRSSASAASSADGELALALALADLTAAGLARLEAEERGRSRARQDEALVRAARALNASLELDEVLRTLAREAAEAVDAEMTGVYLGNAETGGLRHGRLQRGRLLARALAGGRRGRRRARCWPPGARS